MRKIQFANDEYYHICNRGVDKRKVFLNKKDYLRFLAGMVEFNDIELTGNLHPKRSFDEIRSFASEVLGKREPLVEIVAYCLNPNHYHLILKQLQERGIEKYMHRLGTSYTKYFNIKDERSGALFQGVFKAAHIDSNEYLLHASVYVNCNSEIHGIGETESYPWSSFSEYAGGEDGLCDKSSVLGQFKDGADYAKFAKSNLPEIKARKEIELE